MFSRSDVLLLVTLVVLVTGQQGLGRISYADSVIVLSPSEVPAVHSPIHVSLIQGQKLVVPIVIDNSGSNQSWMVFGATSSFPNSNNVNMSFDWMRSMLDQIPQNSNISHVYVSISASRNAQLGIYSGEVVLKLRTGIMAPYSSANVPVTIVITVERLVSRSLFSDLLGFGMIFLGCTVLVSSTALAIYIAKNVVTN